MVNLPAKRIGDSWYPFREIENLQRDLNCLFGYSFPGLKTDQALLSGSWAPAIDVFDNKDDITVKADLPGLQKEDINVSVQDNVLTINGEKKEESKSKEEGCLKTERFYGTFHRSIALPCEIDANKVNATFKDGVLELKLGKKEEARSKQIQIDVK